MSHKSELTLATSLLCCNMLHYLVKHTLLLISTTHVCLLMLMAHKQPYVKVTLNKCRYSSETAVFDMSTVILHNTFKTTAPLVEATVNETL